MQSYVRCPWSLWNSQYLVLSLVVGSDFIWEGHLINFSFCTLRRTCDTEAVRGVNCRGEYHCCSSGCGGPRRSLTFPRLFRDRSLSLWYLCGDLSLSPCLPRLCSYFLSPLLFSFWVEELPRLDMRAFSMLMHFSALVSTSAMFACGFFEMENIRSFNCTLNPTMKAMMANFSSGISTFSNSVLNLCT